MLYAQTISEEKKLISDLDVNDDVFTVQFLWANCRCFMSYDTFRSFLSEIYSIFFYIKGEQVLVIGAGPSGMDLAYEVSKKAERVTLSHHHDPKPKTVFPLNVDQKPDIKRLTETGAEFADGTHQDYSVVLFCTGMWSDWNDCDDRRIIKLPVYKKFEGYKYTFPFLSVDCGISVDDNYVQPLYKHCMNINRPTMALIGLPFYVCASQMFDLQVRFVMKFLSGKKPMPSKEEMLSNTEMEMQKRWDKGYKKRQAHLMGEDQVRFGRFFL